MSLTQQFLIISILPLSFIGMGVYLLRTKTRRRHVVVPWFGTLLMAAIWASSILRFFGGRTFSYSIVFTWSLIGIYAFSLTTLGVLLSTFNHIGTPSAHNRAALAVTTLLWIGALALDTRIFPFQIGPFNLANQQINQGDIWAAVWVASWFIPIVAAFIITQRVNVGLPNSLYRNQVQYWLLVLVLFLLGGIFNAIQQAGQAEWQQAGVLVAIGAGFVGTISITQTHLPDFQLGVRQLLSRLSGTVIIFVFILASLWFLVRVLINLPGSTINNGSAGAQTTIVVLAPEGQSAASASEFVLSGVGGSGTILDILINGEQTAQAFVTPDGTWEYGLELLPGSYSVDIKVANTPANTATVSAQNLIILIAAVVLAALFTIVFQINQ